MIGAACIIAAFFICCKIFPAKAQNSSCGPALEAAAAVLRFLNAVYLAAVLAVVLVLVVVLILILVIVLVLILAVLVPAVVLAVLILIVVHNTETSFPKTVRPYYGQPLERLYKIISRIKISFWKRIPLSHLFERSCPMELRDSITKENLLRAFAGESQARNRYTFAADVCCQNKMQALEQIFLYTAGQEKEHAEIYYNHLVKGGCENITITANYPIDLSQQPLKLLELAREHEMDEFDDIYPAFAQKAEEEGFTEIARHFRQIAAIEKVHADRFERFAKYLRENKLYVSDVETGWMCLNCGHVLHGTRAPNKCPVCDHDQGYFIRLELSPYER